MAKGIMGWINENKGWLFSGIAVAVPGVIYGAFRLVRKIIRERRRNIAINIHRPSWEDILRFNTKYKIIERFVKKEDADRLGVLPFPVPGVGIIACIIAILKMLVDIFKDLCVKEFHIQAETHTYADTLSVAMFQQIRKGMTYEEIVMIIGQDGEQIGRVDDTTSVYQIYQWQKRDVSNVVIAFQNGRVVDRFRWEAE